MENVLVRLLVIIAVLVIVIWFLRWLMTGDSGNGPNAGASWN